MIIKDSGRRLLKSDIIITQTTQGQKRLLVDEGDFTSLYMSALQFPHYDVNDEDYYSFPSSCLFGSFQPFSSVRLHPSDKPWLPRELVASGWRHGGVGECESR